MALSQISTDEATKGFDLSAGRTWIYPENYPVRDYQYNIVNSCLYNNTLVCLPTGLGKTFIAAVVMYNFSRWYPCGKVVFLAPTRPLVAQQIDACRNIMGISDTEIIELTGAIDSKNREIFWSKKRVIFATPQVLENDLEKSIVPTDLVKCVVIDEAHRALGKHSYCQCIRLLSEKNQTFRVVALSATPGNKIDKVHEVLQHLLIAKLELRDDESIDIIPYINKRKVDVMLVPLNKELANYKEKYISIMDRHVRVLLQNNILRGNTANISKGRIFHLTREHQAKSNKSGNYGQIMKTLNILMTMYHAYELMIRDGLRAFYHFYQNHSNKFWMNEEQYLQELLEDINIYLGPFPDAKSLSMDTASNIPGNLVFGHTKFAKLKELLLQHFEETRENNSRAIVFVEYRDIVSEIYVLLLQCMPTIRPQMFVGQAGQKQKQQIKAIQDFRSNRVNVLISTSIGEEGLDVGEIDLIICFDVSQHSPTRLVQRMGRTGRKRDGHIIILVTDGREHETLKSTMARRDSLNHKILNTSNIFPSLYQNNPRMIPDNCKPECIKMHINVQPKAARGKRFKANSEPKENKRQKTIKGFITNTESKSKVQKDETQFSMLKYLTNDVVKQVEENNPKAIEASNVCTIKPSDVKILTNDKDMDDFLMMCAIRDSEKEGNSKNICARYEAYIPDIGSAKNLDFSVPDIKVLNCLKTLQMVPLNSDKLDNNNENDDEMECIVIDDRIGDNIFEQSRFEDLLDEDDSSESNTDFFEEKQFFDPPINNNILATDLKPGKFEELLDMSDSSECELDKKNVSDLSDNFEQVRISPERINDPRLKGMDNIQSEISNKNQAVIDISQTNRETTTTKLTLLPEIGDSEDDMFRDDSILLQVDESKLIEANSCAKYRNEEKTINDKESVQFKSKEIPTENKLHALSKDSESDDEWFSVEKSNKYMIQKHKILHANRREQNHDYRKNSNRSNNLNSDNLPLARKEAANSCISEISNSSEKSYKETKTDTKRKNDPLSTGEEAENSCFFEISSHSSSEESFESRSILQRDRRRSQKRISRSRKKKARNQFIDEEANVSPTHYTSDESSGTDEDLDGFVSYTQNVHDATQMHTHYMQSVRSPVNKQNAFVFKRPPAPDPDVEIYSQDLSQIDESYLYDSFCVAEDDDLEHEELSVLEKAEKKLKKRGKRKREREIEFERKRRNITNVNTSSSSEDEIEKLRKETTRGE